MELRYAQIRNEFEKLIAVGDLKPGDRLPAEVELSTRFETSRATVARALRELEAKGLLRRRRGAGTFVSLPRVERKAVHRLAMFTPWVVQRESIGHFQSHVPAGLSSLCAEHDAELTLPGLHERQGQHRAGQLPPGFGTSRPRLRYRARRQVRLLALRTGNLRGREEREVTGVFSND